MKTLFFLLTIVLALPAFAINEAGVQQLLSLKGTSLEAQARKGNKALLGEVTGHAKSLPITKIEVIITEQEAILKKEIEDIQVNGTPIIGNIQAVRFRGQYITAQDIKGVIVSP